MSYVEPHALLWRHPAAHARLLSIADMTLATIGPGNATYVVVLAASGLFRLTKLFKRRCSRGARSF